MNDDLVRYHQRGGVKFTAREVRALIDLYDAGISEVDTAIGRLIKALTPEERADTIVCVTADHGEELDDHGRFLHGHALYQELIHVPLIFALPSGSLGQAREDQVVQITDIAPTLLDLAGIRPSRDFAGRSLHNPSAIQPRAIVAELAPFRNTYHRAALVEGNQKLIVPMHGDAVRLFDLAQDPGEKHDLSAEHPRRVVMLRQELEHKLAARKRIVKAPPTIVPDASVRERARALGLGYGD